MQASKRENENDIKRTSLFVVSVRRVRQLGQYIDYIVKSRMYRFSENIYLNRTNVKMKIKINKNYSADIRYDF